MSDRVEEAPRWRPWRANQRSGFEVFGTTDLIGLNQLDATRFEVYGRFRFSSAEIEDYLHQRLVHDHDVTAEKAKEMVDTARSPDMSDESTDLASVPPFMRWFESPYGKHTLAGLVHDQLIVEQPNAGALGSDTLSDTFFRKMLGACGVPWIKRWIMWGAVALRSRWAAKGLRRLTLIAWGVIASVGLGLFGSGVIWTIADGKVPTGSWLLHLAAVVLTSLYSLLRQRSQWLSIIIAVAGAGTFAAGAIWTVTSGAVPTGAWILLLLASVLPVVSAPLWGRQWGASFVAAVAGVFVIPAAAFVVLGLGIYWLIEDVADSLGRT
ncbi:MAG: DUF1353 domain-containing protein [bacterium]|nr:DUF1353 domain-containing protein [bacterium]